MLVLPCTSPLKALAGRVHPSQAHQSHTALHAPSSLVCRGFCKQASLFHIRSFPGRGESKRGFSPLFPHPPAHAAVSQRLGFTTATTHVVFGFFLFFWCEVFLKPFKAGKRNNSINQCFVLLHWLKTISLGYYLLTIQTLQLLRSRIEVGRTEKLQMEEIFCIR